MSFFLLKTYTFPFPIAPKKLIQPFSEHTLWTRKIFSQSFSTKYFRTKISIHVSFGNFLKQFQTSFFFSLISTPLCIAARTAAQHRRHDDGVQYKRSPSGRLFIQIVDVGVFKPSLNKAQKISCILVCDSCKDCKGLFNNNNKTLLNITCIYSFVGSKSPIKESCLG